ncbi:MAG: 16S rRNA methyltransferase [Thermoplasmatales archaeon]|nr:16S rRNA methyltransferase [Thermoplasmatales archaeon]
MMHIIIGESELEIGSEIGIDDILDSSIHYPYMRKLKEWRRRGRPDIAHICLLIALESILNKEKLLKIYIHTRNDKVIYINPATRIIKNYNRFKGLMKQLLKYGRVPLSGSPLMKVKKETLPELIGKINGKKILFSRKGKKKSLKELFEEETVCIIGGFPSGDFSSPVEKYVDEVVSLHDEMLPAWIAEMEAIVMYEEYLRERI